MIPEDDCSAPFDVWLTIPGGGCSVSTGEWSTNPEAQT